MDENQKKEIQFPCPHNYVYGYTTISTCEECLYRDKCDVYISMINEDF